MKLIIMRHSDCVGLKDNIINGWLDLELTDEGKKKAWQKAQLLKVEKIDVAFSSYLSRTYDTANIVIKALGQNIKVEQDIRLNERHYGAFQGMERENAYKISSYNTLSTSADRLNNRLIPIDDERYNKQLTEYSKKLGIPKDKLLLPRSESIIDVETRVVSFLKEKVFIPENEDKTILVVGHANTVKLITKYIESLNYEETSKLRFATCGMNIYNIEYKDSKINVLNIQRINDEYVY